MAYYLLNIKQRLSLFSWISRLISLILVEFITSLNNPVLVSVYEGRGRQILDRTQKIKRRTPQMSRQRNLGNGKCIT